MFPEAVTVAVVTGIIGGSFYLAQPIVHDVVSEYLEKKNHEKTSNIFLCSIYGIE